MTRLDRIGRSLRELLEAGTDHVARFQAGREAALAAAEALRMQDLRIRDAELRLEDKLRREREVLAALCEAEAKAAQELAEIEAERRVAEARTAFKAVPYCPFFPDEVTVHYRFHPLAGLSVRFRRHHRRSDGMLLIVERPDGTLVHVPEWMTTPEAAGIELEDRPRLSLRSLAALRDSIDAFLVALQASGKGECDGTDSRSDSGRAVRPGGALAGDGAEGPAAASGGADHGGDDGGASADEADGRRR